MGVTDRPISGDERIGGSGPSQSDRHLRRQGHAWVFRTFSQLPSSTVPSALAPRTVGLQPDEPHDRWRYWAKVTMTHPSGKAGARKESHWTARSQLHASWASHRRHS